MSLVNGIPQSAIKIKPGTKNDNFQDDYNDVCWEIVDDDEKAKGFRIALIVEKTNWDKAIRIYNGVKIDPGVNYAEIKVGDQSGKPCKGDDRLKYDVERVDYNQTNNDDLRMEFWKPKDFGVWHNIFEISISKENRAILGGKTIYFYWSQDNSKFFQNTKENRIKEKKF